MKVYIIFLNTSDKIDSKKVLGVYPDWDKYYAYGIFKELEDKQKMSADQAKLLIETGREASFVSIELQEVRTKAEDFIKINNK